MNKTIPLKVTAALLALAFIVFGVTHLVVIGVLADILLLILIVEGVQYAIAKKRKARD
jgi:hypothetical protein